MQRVDNFHYELPEDFVDEEIDEEMAFTEEDKKQGAHPASKIVNVHSGNGSWGGRARRAHKGRLFRWCEQSQFKISVLPF